VFYTENQGVFLWAIKSADAGQDDPPVYVIENEPGVESWHRESDTMTDFLTSMAYFQAGLFLPHTSDGVYSATTDDVTAIQSRFTPVCRPFQCTHRAEFYGNHDDESLVLMFPMHPGDDTEFFYAAGTQEHGDQMKALLVGIGRRL
jgi:hypothetical protein